tara:strand:- start:2461 stop:3252 length:792 start_codon:yes stop_codon:yes gene_type:complete
MAKRKRNNIPDNGFLIVASLYNPFYKAAIELAESIKLFYPETHVTIFIDSSEIQYLWKEKLNTLPFKASSDWYEHIDQMVSTDVPKHIRAKLWALSKTPYKGKTVYLDADMMCEHEDVENIFDQLTDDLDLLFTKIRPYNAKVTKLTNTEEMTAHCGMFIYRNNPQTITLMESWYGEYLKQTEKTNKGGWVNTIGQYPDDVRKWDTFTMWKLLTYSDHGVRWDDNLHCRWNFVNGYHPNELEDLDRVFYHYTIPEHVIHAKKK